MNIIIDSDVFWASKLNRSCYEALQSIQEKSADRANEFNLIVNDKLIDAYTDFLDAYSKNGKMANLDKSRTLAFAVAFVKDMLGKSNRKGNRIVNINKREVNTSIKLQEIFSDYSILSDEQCLLVIADSMQQIQSKDIVLLLTDPPTETLPIGSPEIAQRQLYQGKTPLLVDDLRKVIPELVIVYTSAGNIFPPKPKWKLVPNVKQADYIFELFSAIWLARTYKCILGPEQVKDEQIDAWCYKVEDNQVTEVYIGEVKHREEKTTKGADGKTKHSEKGIDSAVIKQLANKIKAVKDFDWTKLKIQGSPDIRYYGLIISNSVGDEKDSISESIRSLSERLHIDIYPIIVEVELPGGWLKNDQQKLSDEHFKVDKQTYKNKP